MKNFIVTANKKKNTVNRKTGNFTVFYILHLSIRYRTKFHVRYNVWVTGTKRKADNWKFHEWQKRYLCHFWLKIQIQHTERRFCAKNIYYTLAYKTNAWHYIHCTYKSLHFNIIQIFTLLLRTFNNWLKRPYAKAG